MRQRRAGRLLWSAPVALVLLAGPAAAASEGAGPEPLYLLGIPVDFLLFAATLAGVAVLHHRTLQVALSGLATITLYQLLFTGFREGDGLMGLLSHLSHEWVILANLFLLLVGFAVLSRHFEESKVPQKMPSLLPDDWRGGLVLLALVFVVSAFLDNIAAALIGAATALHVFKGRVHIGYLAAIVAASNAGGSGSVVGDTTTTMIWISGVSPLDVLHAYVAAAAAFLVFAVPAARLQQRYQPIEKDEAPGIRVNRGSVAVVALVLVAAVVANAGANLWYPELLDRVPVIGLAVAAVLLLAAPYRSPDWSILPQTVLGALFLLALVTSASLMPVEKLPAASWPSTLGLGFISAVFDNIPLTALALKQGGYDWGMLAYSVGFGGSMIWFGSSAGVAVSNLFPEAKSVFAWVRAGWPIAVGYLIGFLVLLLTLGWRAHG